MEAGREAERHGIGHDTDWLDVTEISAVAEARRRALAACDALGLPSPDRDRAAIVATEAATNLLRHARNGRFAILPDLACDPATVTGGLAMVAVDRGPGIGDLDRMSVDGQSSAGSAGTGLGAMRRQSDGLDIHTGPDGTALTARIERRGARADTGVGPNVAAVMDRYPGMEVCGDAFAVRRDANAWTVMVCDGLGHGRGAHEAARVVAAAFMDATNAPASRSLVAMSAAAGPTRGAVGMVARLPDAGTAIEFAGVGNVCGLVVGRERTRRLPGRDGRLGGPVPRLVDQTELLAAGETLILHTDGLRTLRDVERRHGLLAREPLTIATVLLRDDPRGNDDACALVVRRRLDDGRS